MLELYEVTQILYREDGTTETVVQDWTEDELRENPLFADMPPGTTELNLDPLDWVWEDEFGRERVTRKSWHIRKK